MGLFEWNDCNDMPSILMYEFWGHNSFKAASG